MKIKDSESLASFEPLPLVRAILLSEIWANPESSGYELMELSSDLTKSYIDVQSGTVYAELRGMEEKGLVTSKQEESGRRRREYRITKNGKVYLKGLQRQIRARVENVLRPLLSLMESLTGI